MTQKELVKLCAKEQKINKRQALDAIRAADFGICQACQAASPRCGNDLCIRCDYLTKDTYEA